MPVLTTQDRELIQFLLDSDWTSPAVAKLLLNDRRGSRTAIYVCVKRWSKSGSVWPSKGGRPCLIEPHIRDWLLDLIAIKSTYWCEELAYFIFRE